MKRFFIENISGDRVFITGLEAKHISTVLRMKHGDMIILFDKNGFEGTGRIEKISRNRVDILIDKKYSIEAEPKRRITIAQGFLKDKKMDTLVRQFTELGVFCLVPFFAYRSVPKPNNQRLESRMERWKKISKEALKQCRGSYFMRIKMPVSFEVALETAENSDLKIVFSENSRNPFSEIRKSYERKKIGSVFIMLGPEGGFEEKEIYLAKKYGFLTASMGSRILRAETAAVAGCALAVLL